MHIKLRYKGTNLGFIWAALEPLFYFVLLYIVFTSIRATTREDFPIYLITGILFFHLFAKGTSHALPSLDNPMLKSLNIKREFFPVVATGSVGLLMFVELGVFFGIMFFFGFIPSWTIIFLPVLMILFLILVLGVSYLLSIVFVYARDIQPIWGVAVHALLFVSPIFWYLKDAKGIVQEIHKFNPLGQLIEMGHKIVFGSIPPLEDWLYTSAIIFPILFIGFAIFKKYENRVVERI